jgi:tRNA threonylcarbamoyladenosine biosynthesis protein TsaB
VLILATDTSSPSGSVAVLRDEKVIGAISTATDETYSSRMFRHLGFLLSEVKLSYGAFDLFAANAGPGSFTGLRVGLTAAKGWAEAYKKPVTAISGLEAVAAQCRSAGLIIPVLDARRGQFYFGCYRREGEMVVAQREDCVGSPEEFWSIVRGFGEAASVVTTDAEFRAQIQELAGAAGVRGEVARYEVVSNILAPAIGQIACGRAKRGEVKDALTVDANYVRRSDAELHWKGRS